MKDVDWISFSETTNSFSIYTVENSLVGDHSFMLIQNFESFPDVHPNVTFQISIKPIVFAQKKPPYFEPPVPDFVEET